jgi:hypothetical protein
MVKEPERITPATQAVAFVGDGSRCLDMFLVIDINVGKPIPL